MLGYSKFVGTSVKLVSIGACAVDPGVLQVEDSGQRWFLDEEDVMPSSDWVIPLTLSPKNSCGWVLFCIGASVAAQDSVRFGEELPEETHPLTHQELAHAHSFSLLIKSE